MKINSLHNGGSIEFIPVLSHAEKMHRSSREISTLRLEGQVGNQFFAKQVRPASRSLVVLPDGVV